MKKIEHNKQQVISLNDSSYNPTFISNSNSNESFKNIMSILHKIREENVLLKEREMLVNQEFQEMMRTDEHIQNEKNFINNKKNALKIRENAVMQEQMNMQEEWKKINYQKELLKHLEDHDLELKNQSIDIDDFDKEKSYQFQIAEYTDTYEKLAVEKEN